MRESNILGVVLSGVESDDIYKIRFKSKSNKWLTIDLKTPLSHVQPLTYIRYDKRSNDEYTTLIVSPVKALKLIKGCQYSKKDCLITEKETIQYVVKLLERSTVLELEIQS